MMETTDDKGRTVSVLPEIKIGEPTGRTRKFEKQGAKVEVFEHEDGWSILGGKTNMWTSDGQRWGLFTAEIRACHHLDVAGTRHRPVCSKIHRTSDGQRGCKGACHETGHWVKVEALAQNVLRSY